MKVYRYVGECRKGHSFAVQKPGYDQALDLYHGVKLGVIVVLSEVGAKGHQPSRVMAQSYREQVGPLGIVVQGVSEREVQAAEV
jgi:hypothetical protein